MLLESRGSTYIACRKFYRDFKAARFDTFYPCDVHVRKAYTLDLRKPQAELTAQLIKVSTDWVEISNFQQYVEIGFFSSFGVPFEVEMGKRYVHFLMYMNRSTVVTKPTLTAEKTAPVLEGTPFIMESNALMRRQASHILKSLYINRNSSAKNVKQQATAIQ